MYTNFRQYALRSQECLVHLSQQPLYAFRALVYDHDRDHGHGRDRDRGYDRAYVHVHVHGRAHDHDCIGEKGFLRVSVHDYHHLLVQSVEPQP